MVDHTLPPIPQLLPVLTPLLSSRPLYSRIAPFVLGLLMVGCVDPTDDNTPGDLGQTGGTSATPDELPEAQPSPAWVRLLTRSEYQRTVEVLLGTQLQVSETYPPEPVVGGFLNHADSHKLNPLLLEQHQKAASLLANESKENGFAHLVSCLAGEQESDSEQLPLCAEKRIRDFVNRAFRRPADEVELGVYFKLFQTLRTTYSFDDALSSVLEAILLAPQFLYRVEGRAAGPSGETIPLDAYELASRLSYFLIGSMPDEELLRAASEGLLLDRVEMEAQARRLLTVDRARLRVREFHEQWLGLSRLRSIARDDAPENFSDHLKESLHLFMDSIFWSEGSSVADLYTSDALFLSAPLAPLYGHDAGDGSLQQVSVPLERSGLLTQPALQSLLAHPDQSAPIKRGVFVRETILCDPVQPPPPAVNNNPPDPDPQLTTRERFAVHTADITCAKCHSLIDPVGFAFESYDALGRYRATENGLPVDSSGAFVELPEAPLNQEFNNALELSAAVAASDTALSCLAEKWLTFALGRSMTSGDAAALRQATDEAHLAGGSMRELLIALSVSDPFMFRKRHEVDGVMK